VKGGRVFAICAAQPTCQGNPGRWRERIGSDRESRTVVSRTAVPKEKWIAPGVESFCHEALFYSSGGELLDVLERFVRRGLEEGDAVLVLLSAPKLASLRRALGRDAHRVEFADIGEAGSNPAWIIPLWQCFIDRLGADQRGRGVGEPISSSQGAAQLVECQIHEALLNVAFDDAPLWLLCPYDTGSLDPGVLTEARRSHPFLVTGSGATRPSDRFPGVEAMAAPWPDTLPPVPEAAERLSVDGLSVRRARRFVQAWARRHGLSEPSAADFALAIHEVTVNSLQHGGGSAEVSIWREGGVMLCEVRDGGCFHQTMAGRRRPDAKSAGGRGLWMANRLCQLVQIRSDANGTAVRLHFGASEVPRGPSTN
jgi:anti-sigma regulatory factor (Ser/Thr protein kinase)